MINLSNSILDDCFLTAVDQTTPEDADAQNIFYMDLVTKNYEIEVCYAERQRNLANPFLRYLR